MGDMICDGCDEECGHDDGNDAPCGAWLCYERCLVPEHCPECTMADEDSDRDEWRTDT